MSEGATATAEVIVCRVTPWYYRRMGLMSAMFLGMGLYFFYDGRIGYPKANQVAATKEWFEKEVIGGPGGYDTARAQGDEFATVWVEKAREKGWIIRSTLNEPRWEDYAAPHGWAATPQKHSPEEIEQQFYWGGAMILAAVIAGLLVLRNHSRQLTGHADHMVMPDGRTVRYADVFRVDKRKWENKGLAYAHYRTGQGAAARRATIDDLMFGGADRVLDRLLAGFSGELIEKVLDEDEDQPAAAADGSGHAAPRPQDPS